MSSILVVEDDRSTRQLLTGLLKTAGFSVTSAKDGVDALKRLRAGSYDLMLLDVWMPKMNGLDVLAALPKCGADLSQPKCRFAKARPEPDFR